MIDFHEVMHRVKQILSTQKKKEKIFSRVLAGDHQILSPRRRRTDRAYHRACSWTFRRRSKGESAAGHGQFFLTPQRDPPGIQPALYQDQRIAS